MSDAEEQPGRNQGRDALVDRLQRELLEMREELEETTRGTLALYNELENKNAELKAQQRQLESKNEELTQALNNLKMSEEARIRAYNHEINNPLAIVFASIDMLKLEVPHANEQQLEQLEKIERAADRIRDVITKIKQYENLLPKSYINWDMLDLESAKVHYNRSDA